MNRRIKKKKLKHEKLDLLIISIPVMVNAIKHILKKINLYDIIKENT